MGVYIKGVKMWENCCDCPCYQDAYDFYPYCMAIEEQKIEGGGHLEKDGKGRHKDCPLVELPEKHGRLIDAEKLKNEYPHDTDWDYPVNTNCYVCESIDNAQTVIEAEDE